MNQVEMQCPICQHVWSWLSGTPAICPRCYALRPIEAHLCNGYAQHTEKRHENQVRQLNKWKKTEIRKPHAKDCDLTADEVLTPREREVLCLVAQGHSNQLVAQQLVISPRTVENHLHNIYSKIYVASRTEATLWAIEREIPFTRKR